MKKIGNVSRYDLDRECLEDRFLVGRGKLSTVVADRKKEIEKDERRLRLIYDAVGFFKCTQQEVMEELRSIVEKIDAGGYDRQQEDWELEAMASMAVYKDDMYLSGGY